MSSRRWKPKQERYLTHSWWFGIVPRQPAVFWIEVNKELKRRRKTLSNRDEVEAVAKELRAWLDWAEQILPDRSIEALVNLYTQLKGKKVDLADRAEVVRFAKNLHEKWDSDAIGAD